MPEQTEHVILILTVREAEWLLTDRLGDERSSRSVKRKANRALNEGTRFTDVRQLRNRLAQAQIPDLELR